jgi:hypothetical protein
MAPHSDNRLHFTTNLEQGYYFDKGITVASGTISSQNKANLSLQTSQTTQVTVLQANGNVGFGIETPEEKLHVNGAIRGDQSGALRISTGNGFVDVGPQDANWSHFKTDRPGYHFDKGITVKSGLIGSANTNLSLQTAGTTQVTVLQENGNVGIGIDKPQAKLDVAQTLRITQADNYVEMAPHSDNRLHFTTNLEQGYYFDKGITVASGTISSQNNANLSLQTTGTTRLTLLQENGNVGIGIDQPQAKLDVAETFRITQADNYVEMAPQPDKRLHFTTNLGEGYYFDKGISVASGTISSQNNANLSLQTTGTTRLTLLQENGNVGIGTENPLARLHIQGAEPIDATGRISSDRTTVTGTQTAFQTELHVGDTIVANGQARIITVINTNRSLTINAPFEPDLEDTTFTYQQPIARLADNQGTTQLIVTSQDDNTIIGATKANAKLQIEGNVTVNGNLGYQGRFFQSSSRELKENITTLSSQEVNEILKGLNAVKFSYKADPEKNMQVGFISEEVPDVLVSPDKKAISNLEIVAILTEAVKEHRKTIRLLTKVVKEQEQKIERLTEKINALEQGN